MANYPTPNNPLILSYKGHIPALKNNRMPLTDEHGRAFFGKNEIVRDFLHSIKHAVPQQVARQGFDKIQIPDQVGIYTRINFYVVGDISTSDGDNAYTTLQETVQTERRDHEGKVNRSGVAAAIEDDRQVTLGIFETFIVRDRFLEGATLYLWSRPEAPNVFNELYELNHYIWSKKDLTVSKRNINLLLEEI